MNKVIVNHKNGWSCTTTASVKMEVYKSDGKFKKRNTAVLTNVFDTGKKIEAGDSVEVLVRNEQDKKYYRAKVLAVTRSGAVKLHLISGGSEEGYSEVLEKIKGGQ